MKVILQQDVKTLGKKGDVVDINDGYARNYVLPRKLGIEASKKNLNDLKLQKQNAEKVAKEKLDEALALSDKLAGQHIVVKLEAGVSGKVFGSVSTKKLSSEIKEQLGLDIDKKIITLDEPIKMLGVSYINIRLHRDVTAKLEVRVEAKE